MRDAHNWMPIDCFSVNLCSKLVLPGLTFQRNLSMISVMMYISSHFQQCYHIILKFGFVRASAHLFHISWAIYGPITSKIARNIGDRTRQELRAFVFVTTKWLPWKFGTVVYLSDPSFPEVHWFVHGVEFF